MTSARKIKARLYASRMGLPLYLAGFNGLVGGTYILKGRQPRKATYSEAMAWVAKKIGRPWPTMPLWRTKVRGHVVSTIFLVTDHGFRGRPVLFETMYTSRAKPRGWHGGRRYYDYDAARKGHFAQVRQIARVGAPLESLV